MSHENPTRTSGPNRLSPGKKAAAIGMGVIAVTGLGVNRVREMNTAVNPAIPPSAAAATEHPGEYMHRTFGRLDTGDGIAREYTDNNHTLSDNITSIDEQLKAQGKALDHPEGADLVVPTSTVPVDQRNHSQPNG